MDQNWEWVSSWRWTEQYLLLQWRCHFKQNYNICCYLVVSPGKVTRSHAFPYKIWVMGRSGFYANCLSVFSLQQKGRIFEPFWEHPSSWNGADGPELFNRCLAPPGWAIFIKGNLWHTHCRMGCAAQHWISLSHQSSGNTYTYYFFSSWEWDLHA